jgi:zinc transport system substrate-binding protein
VVLATEGLDLHEGGHQHDDEHGDGDEDSHDHNADEEHSHDHDTDTHSEDHEHENEEEHTDAEHATEDHEHETDEYAHSSEEAHDEHDHDHGAYDPHTWLDPILFNQTVDILTEAIIAIDPENEATYRANADALKAELTTLDAEYSTALASCALNKVIVTHDSFGYVSERYGFEAHAIAGLSTQDTPSAVTLAALREEAAEGVGAILLEENSVAAFGETLARETGLDTLPVNPIAYVIPEGEDYQTLMRANLATFATALNCNE